MALPLPRSRRARPMLGYLVLLACSALSRALWPYDAPSLPGEETTEVAAGSGERVAFTFEERGTDAARGETVVVLLGAEGFSDAERARWIETLGARFAVLAVRLPG